MGSKKTSSVWVGTLLSLISEQGGFFQENFFGMYQEWKIWKFFDSDVLQSKLWFLLEIFHTLTTKLEM